MTTKPTLTYISRAAEMTQTKLRRWADAGVLLRVDEEWSPFHGGEVEVARCLALIWTGQSLQELKAIAALLREFRDQCYDPSKRPDGKDIFDWSGIGQDVNPWKQARSGERLGLVWLTIRRKEAVMKKGKRVYYRLRLRSSLSEADMGQTVADFLQHQKEHMRIVPDGPHDEDEVKPFYTMHGFSPTLKVYPICLTTALCTSFWPNRGRFGDE